MEHVTKREFKDAMKRIDERFDSIDRRFDDLATMIANGFADLAKRLDVRDRVDRLEAKMAKVEKALRVRL
jgi:hypothetical protein